MPLDVGAVSKVMKTKLSHSQIAKYQMCPKSYQYHYIDKLRPNTTSGALLFGSALDNALNLLLKGGKSSLKKAEVEFEKSFTNAEINDVFTYIPTSTQVVYANSDFDPDLLFEEDYQSAKELFRKAHNTTADSILEDYKKLSERKSVSGIGVFSEEELKFYNYMNWLSMNKKGKLMLDAYCRKVLPRLTKVHEVQRKVSLVNGAGDEIIGFVDLIADVEGVGTVILDNKTSAREYAEDSVIISAQLSLYMHALYDEYKTRNAGYIVMRKGVIKNRSKICSKCGYDGSGARHKTCSNIVKEVRCNGEWKESFNFDIAIQFIVNEIPEQTETIVLENSDTINESIKANLFPRNLNSCDNYYGGRCVYFDLCYKNKPTGLIKKEDR
jgi:hypothetical protein